MLTFRREERGGPPQLRIEIGPDRMTARNLSRHRDPAADVTVYRGAFSSCDQTIPMVITVNCGAPQPYLELLREGAAESRLTVPITHEQQDRILALVDPVAAVCPW